MRSIHFISGLPRSGSTLLAALLAQNPRFHAGMSGPMSVFFTTLLGRMSGDNEFSVFINETQKKAILKGVFENYYAAQSGKVVFDTSRLWCSKMPALAELFPEAKVIACVRETAWIVDSIESPRNPSQPVWKCRRFSTSIPAARSIAGRRACRTEAAWWVLRINAFERSVFTAHTAPNSCCCATRPPRRDRPMR